MTGPFCDKPIRASNTLRRSTMRKVFAAWAFAMAACGWAPRLEVLDLPHEQQLVARRAGRRLCRSLWIGQLRLGPDQGRDADRLASGIAAGKFVDAVTHATGKPVTAMISDARHAQRRSVARRAAGRCQKSATISCGDVQDLDVGRRKRCAARGLCGRGETLGDRRNIRRDRVSAAG